MWSADVAELVDALVLESSILHVRVQVSSSASNPVLFLNIFLSCVTYLLIYNILF